MSAVLTRGLGRVRWYLREFTGEAKWDRYVAECAARGERPMSRRAYERMRDHERECAAKGRCC